MNAAQIRRGLWRWTAAHPQWQADATDGSAASWPRDVGCVLSVTESVAVFFDPLIDEDAQAFWRWADRCCRGRRVVVLETIGYHRRSREDVLARYGAATRAPGGVDGLPIAVAQETIYWIAEHRALVVGDTLIGTGGGELSLCPQSWLNEFPGAPTVADLRQALGVLTALDVQSVLVSHGEPALTGGAAALERALARQ